MERDSVKIFKALSDKSRLNILNNLMESPMYVELLAERLNLKASTISFHLKKLEEVGLVYAVKEQYYVVYHFSEDVVAVTLKELIINADGEKNIQLQREEEYRKNVIDSFFEYGKLKSIPVQQKKRKIVLEEIAKQFEKGKSYTEKEINIIIAEFNDDFCTIRREMIAFNILTRENNIYRLL